MSVGEDVVLYRLGEEGVADKRLLSILNRQFKLPHQHDEEDEEDGEE